MSTFAQWYFWTDIIVTLPIGIWLIMLWREFKKNGYVDIRFGPLVASLEEIEEREEPEADPKYDYYPETEYPTSSYY